MNHNPPLANWLVKFASAELVIAYSSNSPFSPDLEKAAKGEMLWYKVLEEKGFKFRPILIRSCLPKSGLQYNN